MSIFDTAKSLVENVVGKAGDLVHALKHRIAGGGDEEHSDTSAQDRPKGDSTIPSDGAVTPADVAEAVSDPDLPHPEPPPPTENPAGS